MLYPFRFHPIFKDRVWGGRQLATLYAKPLPPAVPIGESWEITDRPEGDSVIANGPLAGRTLRWLMEHHADGLLGGAHAPGGRFPLLVKILDARDQLSLQVHPPAAVAAELGGEPKTELWLVTDATPEADLFAGLKRGVTRGDFERKLHAGAVAECFHRIPVRAGDVMFLPSGRVHAIGAGSVIFEIQQNSDTTYRVFDWNRTGLDGRPRELHVEPALRSIDFADFEPALTPNPLREPGAPGETTLVDHELFRVQLRRWRAGTSRELPAGSAQVLGVISGRIGVRHGSQPLVLQAGEFALLPACLPHVPVEAGTDALFLTVEPA